MRINSKLYDDLENYFSMSVNELTITTSLEAKDRVEIFSIEKKNKEKREIHSVDTKTTMWKVQNFLNNKYFYQNNFPEYVFGFLKGKSYFGFLQYHVSKKNTNNFLKLDIKNFFGSIDTEVLIEDIVNDFEEDTYKKEELKMLFKVVLTYKDQLPQGFQTSPYLSNYYFLRADLRIKKYCDKLDFKYSRYADDIIISTLSKGEKLFSKGTVSMIDRIIADFDLKLNRSKTRVAKRELVLNGFVISSEVRLSQSKLKELRRVLFIIEHNQCKNSDQLLDLINSDKKINSKNKKRYYSTEYLLKYLSGIRAFLISSLKNISTKSDWYKTASKLIVRVEAVILKMY
ncbi:hypothetical protein IGL98_000934 [Enterococcus sp. DIV0840]|uniref:reverse transcriptase family protein n=1 Tax=unclassified Enterococcus TaxID=2608891 RepID=UPI001A8EA204|nr:reverse transcriptase family protein [Enterococcus sp. DIV0849a]MBO0433668.1 RNA-directed DNA polymerase [Enterococcus sp. DIV0849a]